MARRRRPSLAAIEHNATLHPRAFALARERFPDLKWHLYADSPDSSQAFALSAFLPLLEFADKDAILDGFVTTAVGAVPPRAGRSWDTVPEFEWTLGRAGGSARFYLPPTRAKSAFCATRTTACC